MCRRIRRVRPTYAGRVVWARLERLQDRADDGSRKVGTDAIERVHFLAEEGLRGQRTLAAGVVVILPEDHARVLPQDFVFAHITQLNVRDDRDGVARGELLR